MDKASVEIHPEIAARLWPYALRLEQSGNGMIVKFIQYFHIDKQELILKLIDLVSNYGCRILVTMGHLK